MPYDVHRLKQQFLEYLEIEKGRSLKTVVNYDHYLSRFLNYSRVKNVEDVNIEIVRKYRLWLNGQLTGRNRANKGETLKRRTQNYHLVALRAFLKFLARREIKTLSAEMIELAKVGQRDLDLITPEELRRLLDAPNGNDLRSLRDKAILECLFSTGLRVSELCSLARDINLNGEELSVRGKGEKIRVVFLSPDAKSAIKKYLNKRTDMDDSLFVRLNRADARNGDLSMDRRSIERTVKYWAIKTGISKKVTPHVIRHCFATDLLSNGADLRSVQMLLGHANINTTQIYTHITDSQLQKVHRRFHNRRSS